MAHEQRWLFTLGQDHTHRIHVNGQGVTLDCEGVVEIIGTFGQARMKMFEHCGPKWAMQYERGKLNMMYFPRGIVVTIDATDVVEET